MTDRKRNIYTFEEDDPAIVEKLDQRAKQEGTSRSALIRRGIRLVLFSLPPVPVFENSTEEKNATQPAEPIEA